MPLNDQISLTLDSATLTQVDNALTTLENAFRGKLISLTPKQSQQYGKLGNETEGWAAMIKEDAAAVPSLVPDFVSVDGWNQDVATRDQLQPRATRLMAIARMAEDTSRLLGFDIYNTCLSVYGKAKYNAGENVGSAKTYYEKWKVQFPGNRTVAPPEPVDAEGDNR